MLANRLSTSWMSVVSIHFQLQCQWKVPNDIQFKQTSSHQKCMSLESTWDKAAPLSIMLTV